MKILALALAEFAAKAVALAAFLYLAAGLWVFHPAPLAWALSALAG